MLQKNQNIHEIINIDQKEISLVCGGAQNTEMLKYGLEQVVPTIASSIIMAISTAIGMAIASIARTSHHSYPYASSLFLLVFLCL